MSKLTQKVVAGGMSLVLAVGLTPLPAFAEAGDLAAGSTTLSTQAQQKDIDDVDVTFFQSVHTYDGNVFKPAPVVTHYGKALAEGVDYQVTYSNDNPIEVGTYYVSLTGLGAYQGTYSNAASFRIVKEAESWNRASASLVNVKSSFAFTGAAVKPEVSLRLDGIALTAGTDYSVKYGRETYVSGSSTRYHDEEDDTWYYSDGSYQFTEMEPTEAGYYEIRIYPEGAYKTESNATSYKSLSFSIVNAKNLDNANVVWPGGEGSTLTYTGAAVTPKPVVLMDGKELVEGVDYTATAQQYDPDATITENGYTQTSGYVDITPVEVGSYRLKITGIGAYASTTNEPNVKYSYFSIYNGLRLGDAYTDAYFADGTRFAYTGSSIQPKPVVTYRGKTLTEGTDYVLTYTGGGYYDDDDEYYSEGDKTVNVGSYRAVANGIGAYRGSVSVYYSIYNPNDFSDADITLPNDKYYFAYTGAAQMITPDKVELYNTAVTSYTVAYQMNSYWIDAPKEPGYYTMYLIGTGAYAGQSATTGFRIVEENSLLAATVSMTTDYTWNNKSVKPKPVVTLGGKQLKQGTDYSISYYGTVRGSNDGSKKIGTPKAAGSYSVLIAPKGSKYVDSVRKYFYISAASLSTADEATVTLNKEVLPYTGKTQTPKVTVKVNGKKVAASNYTVSYPVESKDRGYYTVTVSGKNDLTGITEVNYSIGGKNVKLKKVTAKSKGFTAQWAKVAKGNNGYQVRYSTNKNMSKAKTKTVNKAKTTKLTVSKLKSGKKYYVQVRTKVKSGGTTYYGNWSAAKAVTTK